MRDSSFSKGSGAGRSGASSGIAGFFRRTYGASMSKNTQSQKQSLSVPASSAAGGSSSSSHHSSGHAIGLVASNLSNAPNANSQAVGQQPLSSNNNNNSKRRSTFGSRLSVHSLFFPSTYSTPVGAPAASVANAHSNATNSASNAAAKSYSKDAFNRFGSGISCLFVVVWL